MTESPEEKSGSMFFINRKAQKPKFFLGDKVVYIKDGKQKSGLVSAEPESKAGGNSKTYPKKFFYNVSDEHGDELDTGLPEQSLQAFCPEFEVGDSVSYTDRRQGAPSKMKVGVVSKVIFVGAFTGSEGRWAYAISSKSGEVMAENVEEKGMDWA